MSLTGFNVSRYGDNIFLRFYLALVLTCRSVS